MVWKDRLDGFFSQMSHALQHDSRIIVFTTVQMQSLALVSPVMPCSMTLELLCHNRHKCLHDCTNAVTGSGLTCLLLLLVNC